LGAAVLGSWSPDGRFVATETHILSAEGSPVVELPSGAWQWSPDGQALADASVDQVTVVSRETQAATVIALPDHPSDFVVTDWGWRNDGTVYVNLGPECGEDDPPCKQKPGRAFVVDVADGSASELVWLSEFAGTRTAWSPDVARVLYAASSVALEDGSLRLPFLSEALAVSPKGTAASYHSLTCAPTSRTASARPAPEPTQCWRTSWGGRRAASTPS